MLIDGPAMLGWSQRRGMNAAASQSASHEAIAGLVESGVRRGPATPTVHLLSEAMNEAALWLANGHDDAALEETMRGLTSMLTGLRT